MVDLQIGRLLRVHRLVAEEFLPNPDDKPQVNHIDGDKSNNRVDNLEWVTGAENVQHAFRTGLRVPTRGRLNGNAKLTDEQVDEIRAAVGARGIGRQLAKKFGVSEATISFIRSCKRWRVDGEAA